VTQYRLVEICQYFKEAHCLDREVRPKQTGSSFLDNFLSVCYITWRHIAAEGIFLSKEPAASMISILMMTAAISSKRS
jgi:hypothetical protein